MIRNLGAIIIDQLRLQFIKSTFESLAPIKRMLDLGCGEKPFASIYQPVVESSVGIEVETTLHDQSHVDAFYDGKKIPFDDGEFDLVLSTEVMEHVPDPMNFLSEIHRVLSKDGVAIITVPFFVPLHEKPYDFYRFTEFALQDLANRSNFKVERLEVFGDYLAVMISLLVAPHLKVWNFLSKKLRLKFLGTVYNPFIFLLIYIPQILYLELRKLSFLAPIFKKMQYMPKGYGIIIRKINIENSDLKTSSIE
jgi:SAM-dependent methyltransferase